MLMNSAKISSVDLQIFFHSKKEKHERKMMSNEEQNT